MQIINKITNNEIYFLAKIKNYIFSFEQEWNLKPIIGCELEFYVSDFKLIDTIKDNLKFDLILTELVEEQGDKQFELKFLHTNDILELLTNIKTTKENLIKISKENNAKIWFDAKPFKNQPGSALHIHLNFLDQFNKNAFAKKNNSESLYLLYSAGGLLEIIEESMVFFAPNKKSYKRYIESMDTPVTISWGGNNRTTAIRIPSGNTGARRLEHRIPCSDASPEAVITMILHGVYLGIKYKTIPPNKIFGNSFDKQYNLKLLPNSLGDAISKFESSKWISREFDFISIST